LGSWLRSVRGDTAVVVERTRPIVLRHHFAVHRRDDDNTHLMPLLDNAKPGAEGLRIDQAVRRALQSRPGSWHPRGRGPRLPFRAPLRTELVEELDQRDMLPAIVFIFSRAACDDAVRQVLRDGIRLTGEHERTVIREIAERRVEPLGDEDLRVLGYDEWLEGLERGVAAHHAGLVPVFRETVEECFAAGLLKVVFATETLSLGINMPARSVVIERFTKYGGSGRATLTSGEYLQLTGRAGRRGLDEEGHAVVAWSNEITFAEAAQVASAAPPDLRSAFRPTYNLAVNLVARFDRHTASEVLQRSFAQWQARKPDLLLRQLNQRVAVLEQMGYVEGWALTSSGRGLAHIYHEADLLIAEALGSQVLAEAEPAVLAGVLSCVVFEPRRARRVPGGHHGHRKGRRHGVQLQDRLGEKRTLDLARRTEAIAAMAEGIRAVEETHGVARTRQPASGLATAVTSWARGASFSTALGVAARDVGELAPGDFVRTMKSVADLAQQVSHTAPDTGVAARAREAVDLLVRGVVAGGLPGA
jgi:superfamily II RNA helicase